MDAVNVSTPTKAPAGGLFRTDTVDGHSHIVYVGPTGEGKTSVSGRPKHGHTVYPKRPIAPQDPEAGTPVFTESNGHTHSMGEPLYVEDELGKPKRERNEDTVSEVQRLFKAAKTYEEKARKQGEESEKFYDGSGQWDPDDARKLKSEDRACLTLNEIEAKVDLLSGYQRQNRTDIKYLPVEGGDARVADVLNVLVKNICDRNDYEFEEVDVFLDEAITGRGLIDVTVDYDRNLEGEIVLEHFPWKDGYFGPHRRPDLRDCEYCIKSRWFSEAKAKQMFPDKFQEIRSVFRPHTELDTEEHPSAGEPEDNAKDYPSVGRQIPDMDFVDMSSKRVRYLECWRRQYERVPVAVFGPHNYFQNLSGVKKSDIAEIKTIFGMRVIDRRVDKVRKTVVAGNTFISDEFTDLYSDFTLIPAYGKKREGMFWGKVHSAKDAQREINKRHSQYVDILNKVAAYGWFYDDETFKNKTDEGTFRAKSSKPGFVQKVRSTNKIPVKVEGVKFPNEVVALAEVSSTKLREIMNINPELLGLNSKAESGVAQIEKKRQGLIGNEFLFDNLSRMKKTLGRLIVRLVQKVYTPERILRVVDTEAAQNPSLQIGGAPYNQDNRPVVMALLQNADLLKYDVAVTESAFSPTQRRANFAAWAELAKEGIPVPPDMLVDLSDLPDKEKVKASIQAMQQAEAQKEEAKNRTEVEKAQIAANSKAQGAPR